MQLSEVKCLYQVVHLIRDTLFVRNSVNLSPTCCVLLELSSTILDLSTCKCHIEIRYIFRSCENDRVIFVCDLSLSKDVSLYLSRAREHCPFVRKKYSTVLEARSSMAGGKNLVDSFRDHYRFAISTRGWRYLTRESLLGEEVSPV